MNLDESFLFKWWEMYDKVSQEQFIRNSFKPVRKGIHSLSKISY